MTIDANRKAQINDTARQAAQQRINTNKGIKNEADVKNALTSSVSIFLEGKMTKEEKAEAYRAYSEELLKNYYDENGDGSVTVEEFAKKETADLVKAGGEEIEDISKRKSYLIAENLDIDGDGKISDKEMTYFNRKADNQDGTEDGKITGKSEAEVIVGITGTNADDKNINRLSNKYLEGKNLDDDAQDFMNIASERIRTEMSKDAYDKYGMSFDNPKLKSGIYIGDVKKPETVETEFLGDSTIDEKGEEEERVTLFTPDTKASQNKENSYTLSGFRSKGQSNVQNNYNPYSMGGYNPYSMGGMGFGMGNMMGYSQPVNKWSQAGNLFGSLLSGFAVIKSIFGGGFGPRWM